MAGVKKAELMVECGSCGAAQIIDLKEYRGKVLTCAHCGNTMEVGEYIGSLMGRDKSAQEIPQVQFTSATYKPSQEPVVVSWQNPATSSSGCGCGAIGAMILVLIGVAVVGAIAFGALSGIEGVDGLNEIADTLNIETADSAEVSQVLPGHSSWVTTIAYSPDGRYLASGSQDYTTRLWDVTTGNSILLEGPDYTLEDLEFSPDGSILAGVNSRGVYLWEMPSGKLINRSFGDYYFSPKAISFSADGEWLTFADSDTAIWEVDTGEQVRVLSGANLPNDILFSPDGKYVATINSGSDVILWDMRGLLVKQMTNDANTEANLSFSPDGNILAYAGSDSTTSDDAVYLYYIAEDRLETLKDESFWLPYFVEFSSDGEALVVGDWSDKITVWDVAEKDKLFDFETETAVQDVIFSPDGSTVTAAGRNGKIYSWIVFPDKQQAKSEEPSAIPALDTPVCFITARSDAQIFQNPDDENHERIMNKDYQAEINGRQFVSDVLWYRLREGTWVRSDFVSADPACEEVELIQ